MEIQQAIIPQMSIETRKGFHRERQMSFGLGKRLIAAREASDLSQNQAAWFSKISQGYFCQLENDEVADPSYRAVVAVSRGIGTSLYLFDSTLENIVFLKPHAAFMEQIVSAPDIDSKRKENIRNAITILIPDTDGVNLRHMGFSSKHTESMSRQVLEARKSLGMSQGQLAVEIGMSQANVSEFENDRGGVSRNRPMHPSFTTAKNLSKALRINLLDLLGLEEKSYPPEIVRLDTFLRNDKYTSGQKKAILNRLFNVVAMIQPLVNELDSTPGNVNIS